MLSPVLLWDCPGQPGTGIGQTDWSGTESVIEALQELVVKHNRWGFWKCYKRFRLDGHEWNHKRVYRIYRELGLNMRRKTKKRIPTRDPLPMVAPDKPNVI